MSRQRRRSSAYRARRRVRTAARHLRAAHQAEYQVMLERTPGYAEWLERLAAEAYAEERLLEWGAR